LGEDLWVSDNIKSFASYCNTYQMTPYERICELIEDLISHKISAGAIYNFLNEHHNNLESFQKGNHSPPHNNKGTKIA